MEEFIIIGLLSLVSSIIYQLFLGWLFRKYHLFVEINHRSSHNAKATATGGIAIFLSLITTTLYFYFTSFIQIYDYSIILPLSILFIVGFYDDLENADFKLKLLLQLIVAKLLIDQGFVLDEFYLLNGLFIPNYFFAQILTGILITSIINSINFIDGIDGLAIGFCLFVLMFTLLFTSNNELLNLNLILTIALLSGLYFNLKSSNKVFLGDSGSLFVGGIISINAINLLEPDVSINFDLDPNKFLLFGLIMFYPLVDSIRTIMFRILNNKSPFVADKTHFHHIIYSKTNSHSKTLLYIIGFCITFLSVGLSVWKYLNEIGLVYFIFLSAILSLLFIRKKY